MLPRQACCPQLNRRVYFISSTPPRPRRATQREQHLHSLPSCKEWDRPGPQRAGQGIPECHRDANLALSSWQLLSLSPPTTQTLGFYLFHFQGGPTVAHGPFTGVTRRLCGCSSRSREQNPGGAALLPAPAPALPSQRCGACQEAPAAQRVHTLARPRTWVSCGAAGWQAASHSRHLGNSHTPQINSHLRAGAGDIPRLLLISLPANALKSRPPAAARLLCRPLGGKPSGHPRIMQLVPAHSSATWT